MFFGILAITIFSNLNLFAQKNFFISANCQYGVLLPHHHSFYYFINGKITAFELQAGIHTFGEKNWHSQYNYPDLGVGLFYSSLNNNQTLGNVTALYYFINGKIFNLKKIGLNYDVGLGIARSSAPFDINTNLYNIAIGSKHNAFIRLGTGVYYNISEKLKFKTGIKFSHYSNGAFETPNKGINIFTINASITYSFNSNNPEKIIVAPRNIQKHHFYTTYSAGVHEVAQPNGNKYFVSSLALDYVYKPKNKSGFGIGGDIIYDSANKIIKQTELQSQVSKVFYGDIHAGYYLFFGKTLVGLQVGPYVVRPSVGIGVFSRLVFKYNITRNVFVNLSLKTYFSNADFIEFGVGYKFYK